ncbi:Aryl-alcohol dehydrogenase protein [Rutstroemia sp. NJR-2017a WRK4]|nr:Aryl-alcohol dehydrogenase protein [Rutstroemia sp. NJR-2017a WRK4]PQE14783.1 Aryl-alcohol dehydrogenase protein [Rutstroemia sp. NJR-2017a WRK4]
MTTTSTTTTIQHSRQYFLTTSMDSSADKEERKREYNRLAQREFRRRRKEHLKNLEQAQKEQNNEQSEEIERLRYQNDELRRENEALRAQLFGTTSQGLLLAPVGGQLPTDHRQYSLSPSISGASMSNAGSPPASLSSDFMPMGSMSMTSSMNHPPMHAYNDPIALSSQPYSMVPQSELRSHNAQSSPESSGYQRNPTMGSSSFQHPSLNIPRTGGSSTSADQSRSSSRPNVSIVMPPYDRKTACKNIRELFQPLVSDPAVLNGTSPERHLAILRSIADVLPSALKPSKTQLETPHFYAIDMIASPSLRERLMNLSRDVAQSFIRDFGSCIGEAEDVGQVIIWGDDPYNEISWEVSQPVLERWGWLLGRDFVDRSNAWRRQRGAPSLPEW